MEMNEGSEGGGGGGGMDYGKVAFVSSCSIISCHD